VRGVRVARAIGWVFVAFIGYHALLAAADAQRAGAERNWAAFVGYGANAEATAALVIGAGVHACQRARRKRRANAPSSGRATP
jgi:hypothetical protein